MKKLVLLFVLIVCFNVAGVILFSCKNSCSGQRTHIRLDSLDASAFKITGSDERSGVLYVEVYSGAKVKFDSIGILIGNHTTLVQAEIPTADGSLITYASACDPNFSYDQVKSISVTSSVDYNEGFKAGAELKSILVATSDFKSAWWPNADIVVNNNLPDVLYRFTVAPSAEKVIDLTFRYELLNGKTYQATVKNIHLF